MRAQASDEVATAAVQAMQSFLDSNPGALALLVTGRARETLGAVLRHYKVVPPPPHPPPSLPY